MCEPTSIALIASTVITGAAQAHIQRQEGKANAAIAENNARLAEADADATNAMATRESEQQAWRTRALIGQQRASIAANNLDPTFGTPADLMGEAALFGEVDQQTIRMNAARQAWGFNAQAGNYRNEGALARWSGNARATGTILGALAEAGTQAYSAYGNRSGGRSRVGRGTTGTINNGASMGGWA